MHVVESVRTAITILRFLASQSKPFGVNAIAREVGVSPSSCFNIVKTLTLEGLLAFDERDKSYSPGPGLAMLSTAISNDQQLFQRNRARTRNPRETIFLHGFLLAIDTEAAGARPLGAGCGSVECTSGPGAAAASSDRGDGTLHRRRFALGPAADRERVSGVELAESTLVSHIPARGGSSEGRWMGHRYRQLHARVNNRRRAIAGPRWENLLLHRQHRSQRIETS